MFRRKGFGIIGLAVLLAAGCGSAQKQTDTAATPGMENALRARVERVVDVNTIVISANGMEETVRLVGVKKTGYELPSEKCEAYQKACAGDDAHAKSDFCEKEAIRGPGRDLKHLTNEVKSYRSEKAAEFTKRLVQDEHVLVFPLDPARDEEKNLQALVYRASDKLFVNYAIVRMGYGLVAEKPAFDYLANFRAAEQSARQETLGLWGAPLPGGKPDAPEAAPSAGLTDDYIVFISGHDRKYHTEHCRKLDETRYPVQLKDAKQGKYQPCKLCCPGD